MTFRNSPISEAIFDIKVVMSNDFSLEKITSFEEKIKEDYPIKKIINNFQTELQLEENTKPNILFESAEDGYLFISHDATKIVQAKLDGFTFSKLKPYDSWEEFSKEAYKLWENYIEIVHPVSIKRLALRYINRIEIPSEQSIELKDYLKTYPEISNEGITLIDHFMRLVIKHEQYKPSVGIINQVVDTKEISNSKILPIIFDIDVFQDVTLNYNTDSDEVKNIFENNLRPFRTEIFFESLTKKTKDLFQ